jgi:hypothetical protein
MRTALIVVGGLYLSVSAAYGSTRLLAPFIGIEWTALVGVITFGATILVIDEASPKPRLDLENSIEARLAKLRAPASRPDAPPNPPT